MNERCMKKLENNERRFVYIPSRLLLDEEQNKILIPLICYLQIRKGMDDISLVSINDVVEWMGKKPHYSQSGINMKILSALKWLDREGYIQLFGEPEHKCFIKLKIDSAKLWNDEFGGQKMKYAVVYLDEIEKILEGAIEEDNYFKRETLLLVLTWIRTTIGRRLKYDEGIEDYPEICYGYYKNIAEHIGLSERAVSKAAHMLRDLKLIYFEESQRYKCGYQWKHNVTFFCNYYRRDNNVLTAYGADYYEAEIEAGVRKMNEHLRNAQKGFRRYEDIKFIEQFGTD